MRVVIQRVKEASVQIAGTTTAAIEQGLLILLGIGVDDDGQDTEWLCRKISQLRIFSDQDGLMNQSIQEVSGGMIVVSQFTLHASTKKGNRPSYIRAARPEQAIPLYENFIQTLAAISGCPVQTGVFGADMQVSLINDGPVTIVIDSLERQ